MPLNKQTEIPGQSPVSPKTSLERSGSLAPADPSTKAGRPSGNPRRQANAVQSPHFKAFWIRAGESSDLVQTVVPKRMLKKAVDRNGLRRIIREAVREHQRAQLVRTTAVSIPTPVSTPRIVLISHRGFKELPSRRLLKLQWRQELDGLLNQLQGKLR